MRAPRSEAGSKMRTGRHFDADESIAASLGTADGSMGGKFGAQMGLGHHGFGAKSSKGASCTAAGRSEGRRAPQFFAIRSGESA